MSNSSSSNDDKCLFLQIPLPNNIEVLDICLSVFKHVCLFGQNLEKTKIHESLLQNRLSFPIFVFDLNDERSEFRPITNNNSIFMLEYLLHKKIVVIDSVTFRVQTFFGQTPSTRMSIGPNFNVKSFKDVVVAKFCAKKNKSNQFGNSIRKNATVVLDLDETLLHTTKMDSYDLCNNELLQSTEGVKMSIFTLSHSRNNYRVLFHRPYLDMFIDFCFRNFARVIIWSAGSLQYVQAIVHIVFLTKGYVPSCVLSRNDLCFENGDTLKVLKQIQQNRSSNPFFMSEEEFMTNIWTIDDRRSVAMANIDKLISIIPFIDENVTDKDNDMLRVMGVLQKHVQSC